MEDANRDSVLNPIIIVEVLSLSTEAADRGAKFIHYRHLESIRAYVLVSQAEAHVEVFARAGKFWHLGEAVGIDANLHLSDIDCDVPLAEIYRDVIFEESSKAPQVSVH